MVKTPAPTLSISLGQGGVTIAWPATGRAYILQTSTNVTGGWTTSGLIGVQQGGLNIVTDTLSSNAKFYRLQKGP